MGHNWSGYDHHFRIERENNPCSWATLRPDLQLQYTKSSRTPFWSYNNPSTFRHSPFNTATQAKPFNRTTLTKPEGKYIPIGYCLAFHTRNTRCEKGASCKFEHKCPQCSIHHSVYRQCPTKQTKTSTTSTTQPLHLPTPVNADKSHYLNSIHYPIHFTKTLIDGFNHDFYINHSEPVHNVLAKNQQSILNHNSVVKEKSMMKLIKAASPAYLK